MAKSDVLVRMKADTSGYDANIAKARRQLDQFKKDNLSMGGVMKQLSGNLVATAAKFASVTAAVGALGAAFRSNIETARGFEKSMSQLSSLTGMVGADLEKLKGYAIELGSSTTLSASQVADAFKMIGSQQPQLLESGEALKAVTKNAITLAEAAGIELADAAKTLSVSINQMGGDSNNAERYINVLAAAAQKGAGDIAWLGEAITKSGTTAKSVGTDYEELVANLEQLAKAGYDAGTAGTALRSIIMNLEKQANNDFKPSVVGLTQAFENLGKANLTLTQYQEIAGKMFAAQAKALAEAAGEAKNMTEAITGTNTAEEQAKTNTDNLDGSIKALASAWEGFNLHLNSSNGLLRDVVDWLKDVVVWADKAYQALEKYYNGPNIEETLTKNLPEVGSNVDDKGNYIKRPANGNWKGFDADNGTWKEGYWGPIYNAQTGQTELPEITVGGKKKATTLPTKNKNKGGSSTQKVPTAADFEKFLNKSIIGAESLKGKDDANFVSPYAMMLDDIKKKILDVKDADLGKALDIPDVYKQRMTEYAKGVEALKISINSTANVIGTIGQAFNSIENPAAKVAGIVAQSIANVALAYSDALAKTEGEKFNIWSFIAAAAASTISMVQTISSIHSATGYQNGGMLKGYSTGGTIQGTTYSGDQIGGIVDGSQLVGLNAGEIVLNKAQSANLAGQLQGSGLRGMSLKTKVKGTELLVWLDNSLAQSGRGELMTWGQ